MTRSVQQFLLIVVLVVMAVGTPGSAVAGGLPVEDLGALLQRSEQFKKTLKAYQDAREYYASFNEWRSWWALSQSTLKGVDAHKHLFLTSWLQREAATADANELSTGHEVWGGAHNQLNDAMIDAAYRTLSKIVDRNVMKTEWPEVRLLARNAAAVETTVKDSMAASGAYRQEQEWLDAELEEIEAVLKMEDSDATKLSAVQVETLGAWSSTLTARQLRYLNRLMVAQNQMAELDAIARNNERKQRLQTEFDRRQEIDEWVNFDVDADVAAFRGSRR